MQMFVMKRPWADALQPGAVDPLTLAEVSFDRGIDEDARHPWILRGKADQLGVLFGPSFAVQLPGGFVDQDGLFEALALDAGQRRQIQTEPDVDVQTALVADMPIGHRAAARLRHIADEHGPDASPIQPAAKVLDVIKQRGMPVVTVTLHIDGLVTLTFGRQLYRASQTRCAMLTDYSRLAG